MVGYTQRQTEQADDGTDQPLGLPVGEAEHGAQYLLIPGVGRGSSGGIDEALDVTTGLLIQARDGAAP